MSLFLSMLFLSLSSVHGADICESGASLTQSPEVKCEADYSCDGCSITCGDCKLLNCGGVKSCLEAIATITPADGFTLECNKLRSCKKAEITITSDGEDIEYIKCNSKLGCRKAEVTIDCGGGDLKGVSCNGVKACSGATFTFIDCDVEKVECDGNYGCQDATFIFSGDSDLDEFNCGGGTYPCSGVTCTGVDVCP